MKRLVSKWKFDKDGKLYADWKNRKVKKHVRRHLLELVKDDSANVPVQL
jgi:hypothetical protein